MNKNPLVSFCLFCYNQEEFIEEAIEGALDQTYSPLEIIISDDCSTDSTFQIIEKKVANYKGPHKLIVRQNPKNLGLAEHVNTVLYKIATGEYFAMAAGDDISLPERIDTSIIFFRQNPDIVALSSSLEVINNKSIIQGEQISVKKNQIFDLKFYSSLNFKHINGPSRILKREIIKYFPPLNKNCPTEDTTFLLRCFIIGKVAQLEKKLVLYRKHANNITSKKNIHKIKVSNIFKQYKKDISHANKQGLLNKQEFSLVNKRISKLKQEKTPKTRNIILKYAKKGINIIPKLFSNKTLRVHFLHKVFIKFFPSLKFLFDAFLLRKAKIKDIFKSLNNYYFNKEKAIFVQGLTESKNFGDALNVPFFTDLVGMKTIETNNIPDTRENKILAIGSILHLCDSYTYVWGAGCVSQAHMPGKKPKQVCAVRGPLTRDLLIKCGINCPNVFGDPALLLPFLYKPNRNIKKYKYGVIPHYIENNADILKTLTHRSDVKIININTGRNYKKFINIISSCEIIISSSLHGLIIADAYNIPNIWVNFSNKVIGNGFKFRDYFLSVNKPIMQPIKIENLFDEKIINEFASQWIKPQIDLEKLIDSFPFELINDRGKINLQRIKSKMKNTSTTPEHNKNYGIQIKESKCNKIRL